MNASREGKKCWLIYMTFSKAHTDCWIYPDIHWKAESKIINVKKISTSARLTISMINDVAQKFSSH